MPVVIGGDNLLSPVGIGLTDLPNIGGASGPPGPPGSGITVRDTLSFVSHTLKLLSVCLNAANLLLHMLKQITVQIAQTRNYFNYFNSLF